MITPNEYYTITEDELVRRVIAAEIVSNEIKELASEEV